MSTIAARPETGQKRFMDLTKEEMEAELAEATQKARDNLHAQGLPYIIGDTKGTYAVYPDNRRVFTPYKNSGDDGR